jgi:hypothetical protein
MGYRRERWDRTQASLICVGVALVGCLPTWLLVVGVAVAS